MTSPVLKLQATSSARLARPGRKAQSSGHPRSKPARWYTPHQPIQQLEPKTKQRQPLDQQGLQEYVKATREQIQQALFRSSPEAAFVTLAAFAQDIQDVNVSQDQYADSRSEQTSHGSARSDPQGMATYSMQTRHAIGDHFRGLHRRIMQACIEQVRHGAKYPMQHQKAVGSSYIPWPPAG